MARSRSRSRSPRRSTHSSQARGGGGGFRWKEKSGRDSNSGQERGLDRGYRNRDQDDYRQRNDERERRTEADDRERRGEEKDAKAPRRRDEKKDSKPDEPQPAPAAAPDNDIIAKFGASAATRAMAPFTAGATTAAKAAPSKPPPRNIPTGPMIVVKINDRLGTTSKVPCLPSDSIGDLKKLVAMRIGRKPHEIMLKRQSERPFKDFLTLEDYGIGDGVQLDLELDTGD